MLICNPSTFENLLVTGDIRKYPHIVIYDGRGVPPVPPIFNVDLLQSLEYPEGGRPKGIYFASPLTDFVSTLKAGGVTGGHRCETVG